MSMSTAQHHKASDCVWYLTVLEWPSITRRHCLGPSLAMWEGVMRLSHRKTLLSRDPLTCRSVRHTTNRQFVVHARAVQCVAERTM